MSSSHDENQPLLRGSTDNDDIQRYNASPRNITVKSIDEEYIIDSSSSNSNSSSSTIDMHDPEYIVNNRLGDVSLSMVVFW
jgi:hypothetical protein